MHGGSSRPRRRLGPPASTWPVPLCCCRHCVRGVHPLSCHPTIRASPLASTFAPSTPQSPPTLPPFKHGTVYCLSWASIAVCGLSLVAALGLLLLCSMGSGACGLSSCGSKLLLSRAGLVALWDVSSPTRSLSRVACLGRQICNHWATRDVPVRCKYQSLPLLTQNCPSIPSFAPPWQRNLFCL